MVVAKHKVETLKFVYCKLASKSTLLYYSRVEVSELAIQPKLAGLFKIYPGQSNSLDFIVS